MSSTGIPQTSAALLSSRSSNGSLSRKAQDQHPREELSTEVGMGFRGDLQSIHLLSCV